MAQDPGDEQPRVETIEWADHGAEERRWLAPASTQEPATEATPRQPLNYLALGLAVAGFVAMLAAEYLPWMHVSSPTTQGEGDDLPAALQQSSDVELGGVGTTQIIGYDISVVLALAAVAVVLVVGQAARRLASAVALGLLAGSLALLVGVGRAASRGAGAVGPQYNETIFNVSLGPGFACAVVATALLTAAVLVVARGPMRHRPDTEAVEDDAGEPLDLTVTPLPSDDPR